MKKRFANKIVQGLLAGGMIVGFVASMQAAERFEDQVLANRAAAGWKSSPGLVQMENSSRHLIQVYSMGWDNNNWDYLVKLFGFLRNIFHLESDRDAEMGMQWLQTKIWPELKSAWPQIVDAFPTPDEALASSLTPFLSDAVFVDGSKRLGELCALGIVSPKAAALFAAQVGRHLLKLLFQKLEMDREDIRALKNVLPGFVPNLSLLLDIIQQLHAVGAKTPLEKEIREVGYALITSLTWMDKSKARPLNDYKRKFNALSLSLASTTGVDLERVLGQLWEVFPDLFPTQVDWRRTRVRNVFGIDEILHLLCSYQPGETHPSAWQLLVGDPAANRFILGIPDDSRRYAIYHPYTYLTLVAQATPKARPNQKRAMLGAT